MTMRSCITGLGFHVPERVVRNADLEAPLDTSDAWIVERTGIRERRYASPGTGSADLAVEAARKALADAGRSPAEVDFVVFATITPDHVFPGNGPVLQERLGLRTVGTMDIHNACTGFLHGLATADAFVRAGIHRCVLVVGAEVQSTGIDLSTAGRDMAVLFADGAGAAVVEPSANGRGVLSTVLHSEGAHVKALWAEAPTPKVAGRVTPEMLAEGRHYPRMEGRLVFRHATTRIPEVIREALERAGHTIDDVALVVPHQANQRILRAVAERLGVPCEKVFQNVQRYGNTTAASIPIALAEARDQGRFRAGDLVVLSAFGAGFAWGAVVLRW
jgi:3-oxoacyl-[acyl-carrier-protein] synthase-3